jgi:hypothetical protein
MAWTAVSILPNGCITSSSASATISTTNFGTSSFRMLCPAVFDAQQANVDQFTFALETVSASARDKS